MVWNFTPKQLQDPDKVVEYLKGECCGYSKEAQLTALCWALATLYQSLLDRRQHHHGGEGESRATGTAATKTPVAGTAPERRKQPMLVSVNPIHKKKYTKKSVCLVRDDDEPGPSQEQEEETEPEIITRSLSLSELQDMRKDFSCHPASTSLPGCSDAGITGFSMNVKRAAIKQATWLKPLWYEGWWLKYKYGEAWQIDYITLPQPYEGKHRVLAMVEATARWLETYPMPHATAQNTILGLEKQLLW
ncbi:hypothetical protein GRJ2_001313200 [Grus japonensis]|uniref:Uncharacterized protein n=1 Tax=Grus japonensis TaxID=30415 RepID=A0ABC9WSV3_GRUJA